MISLADVFFSAHGFTIVESPRRGIADPYRAQEWRLEVAARPDRVLFEALTIVVTDLSGLRRPQEDSESCMIKLLAANEEEIDAREISLRDLRALFFSYPDVKDIVFLIFNR